MKQYKTTKIFIIFTITIMTAACSSFKLRENKERGVSPITIGLDRVNYPFSRSSIEERKKQTWQIGSFRFDKKVIYQAQKKLKRLGYNPGPLDGIWGPKTQKAIKKFQQDNSLLVTGNLDEQTRLQLMHIVNGEQEAVKSSVDRPPKYSLMTAEEARQIIEGHIKNKDIELEAFLFYRKHSKDSESEIFIDVFQGIKFDSKNYLVLALCKPAYMIEIPSKGLQDKLAKLKIDIPDSSLSFTFNGVFYSTVDLEVKTNLVFSYTDQNGFISDDIIPKGGYEWFAGEYGLHLGNMLILFQSPLKKKFLRSRLSQADVMVVKLSSQRDKGIFLDLYQQ